MKKYCIAIAVSILLSVIIELVILVSCVNTSLSQEQIDKAHSVLSHVALTTVNAELDGNLEYTVREADAQLYIDGIDKDFGALIVKTREPFPNDTRYQLYYTYDGSSIGEISSVSGKIKKDESVLAIRLPEFRHYDTLRLDIDDNYRILDIELIDDETLYRNKDNDLTLLMKDWSRFPLEQFLLCVLILSCESLLIVWKYKAIKRAFINCIKYIRENRDALLRALIICLICVLDGLLIWSILYYAGLSHSRSIFTLYCFASIGMAVGLLIVLNRQLASSPEIGFLVIAICIGLMFAVLEPTACFITFDDEIHYGKAVRLSYGNTDYITTPEEFVYFRGVSPDTNLENRLISAGMLNNMVFRGSEHNGTVEPVQYYNIPCYLPAAAAIWLTRILGFSAANTIMAGRTANMLCYAFVIYFAIKQLKYGKLFASSLCLMPMLLFMAGNFSYDPFCIAFIMLGVCIWLGVYQRPEARMTGVKAVTMLTAFFFGISTKAVYFPFMLTALFLPERHFSSKKAAKRYRWAIILTAVILAATFAVPFLFSSNNDIYSDTRGGNVQARDQFNLILSNPVWYAKMVLVFLFRDYFTFENIMDDLNGCVRSFSYMSGWRGVVFPLNLATALLVMIFIAWIVPDARGRIGSAKIPLGVKIVAVVMAVGSMCIAATGLYCSFTPVGAPTVYGFQTRYMLPVVLPLLVILRPLWKTRKEIKIRWMNAGVLYAEALLLVAGLWPFLQRYL